MQRIIILLFCLAVIFGSCDDPDAYQNDIGYFQQRLKPDMKYTHLKLIFGPPDADIGSGIHIYVYDLDDGTKVCIGYTDTIVYARHLDQNDQLLAVLI